eukprot:m.1559122 g.1559122  ORF g.1559122 m.1559122 type:complete len:2011 (+) comp25275_c1_seq7:178-6210(+)
MLVLLVGLFSITIRSGGSGRPYGNIQDEIDDAYYENGKYYEDDDLYDYIDDIAPYSGASDDYDDTYYASDAINIYGNLFGDDDAVFFVNTLLVSGPAQRALRGFAPGIVDSLYFTMGELCNGTYQDVDRDLKRVYCRADQGLTSLPPIPPRFVWAEFQRNEITSVNLSSFGKLYSHIMLYSNAIANITGSCARLKLLKYIYLSQNQLTWVPSQAFSHAQLLEVVVLSNNLISTIESGAFAHSGQLSVVDLSDNRLSNLPTGLFNKSTVQSLYLSNNGFTRIPANVFVGDGDVEIAVLTLRSNRITMIGSDDFAFADSLAVLDCRSNFITRIESGAFVSTPKLITLLLDRNNLDALVLPIVSQIRTLGQLSMMGNELSVVPRLPSNILHVANESSGFPVLKRLLLNNNQITTIVNGAFAPYVALEVLLLEGNQLSQISQGAFQGLHELKRLGLSFNAITSVAVQGVSTLPLLMLLDMNGNPLRCNASSDAECQCETRYQLQESANTSKCVLSLRASNASQVLPPRSIYEDKLSFLTWAQRTKFAIGTSYYFMPVHIASAFLGTQRVNVSDIEFAVDPVPLGLLIDVSTGYMQITPQQVQHVTTVVYARVLDRTSNALYNTSIGKVDFDLLWSDVSNTSNGPAGRGCVHGTPVDVVEFDGRYTCNCSGTAYTGPNCNQTVPLPPLLVEYSGQYEPHNGLRYVLQSQRQWAINTTYYVAPVNITDATYDGIRVNTSALTYDLEPLPRGFFVDTSTGTVLATPQAVGNTTCRLVAMYPGTVAAVVYTIQFDMLLADVDVAGYGPNGRPCAHGVAVDAVPFDHRYTCNCTDTLYTGPNCNQVQPLPLLYVTVDGQYFPADGIDYMPYTTRLWTLGDTHYVAPANVVSGTVNDVAINVSQLSYFVDAACEHRDGIFVDTATGEILFDALHDGILTCSLYAQYPGSQPSLLYNVTFDVRPADTSVAAYGPNGQPCANGGLPVDVTPFDHAYTCNCSGTQHRGPNCADVFSLNVTSFAQYIPQHAVNDTASARSYAFLNQTQWAINETYLTAPVQLGASYVGTQRVNTSQIEFELRPIPPGFFVNTESGEILGEPATEMTMHSAVYATYPATVPALLATVTFAFLPKDTSDPANGPNGRGCAKSSEIVDTHPFDGVFTCNCSLAGYATDSNCNPLQMGSHEQFTKTNVAMATGSTLAALLCVLGIVVTGSKLRRKHAHGQRKRRVSMVAQGLHDEETMPDDILFSAIEYHCITDIPDLLKRGADATLRSAESNLLPVAVMLRESAEHEHARGVLLALLRRHCVLDVMMGEMLAECDAKLALMCECMQDLAREQWRSTDGRAVSIVHVVIDACKKDAICDRVATRLCRAVMDVDSTCIHAEDANRTTPIDLISSCAHAVELQRLLAVMVYGSVQLVNPTTVIHQSETSVVIECTVCDDFTEEEKLLTGGDSDTDVSKQERLVVKMMQSASHWRNEIEQRRGVCSSNVMAVYHAFHPATINVSVQGASVCVHKYDPSVCQQSHHERVRTLMQDFPYGICMPLADRNLLEIIQQERPGMGPISVPRYLLKQVAEAVAALHRSGIVHGDIKPRNVVRKNSGQYCLIDLDMSMPCKGQVGDASGGLRDKILASSAYMSPEVIQWTAAQHITSDSQPSAVQNVLEPRTRWDLWGFGVTMYEVLNGAGLLESRYDVAMDSAVARLQQWGNLTPADLEQLHEARAACGTMRGNDDDGGSEGLVPAIDLLQWLLDCVPERRPRSMEEVLDHAFFNPAGGALHDHFVVDEIRRGLSLPTPRRYGKVMLSYAWANTEFAVRRVAVVLAPLVQGLWLDRLGGDNGMKGWIDQSMQTGVQNADVVVSVVSKEYLASKNCGKEVTYASQHGKPIIILLPTMTRDAFQTAMQSFRLAKELTCHPSGITNTVIDFTDKRQFRTVFDEQLLPVLGRLTSCPRSGVAMETASFPRSYLYEDSDEEELLVDMAAPMEDGVEHNPMQLLAQGTYEDDGEDVGVAWWEPRKHTWAESGL